MACVGLQIISKHLPGADMSQIMANITTSGAPEWVHSNLAKILPV